MKRECCNFNCEQGDRCPLRANPPTFERRTGPSLWRRLFGWILHERRSGLDRRK